MLAVLADARGRARSALWLGWLLFACAGCVIEPQNVVVIDAEPETRLRARWLRVEVDGADGVMVYQRVVELGVTTTFPVSIPVTARGGDANRTFALRADAFDGVDAPDATRAPFNTLRLYGGFAAGRVLETQLTFTDPCVDVACATGATCWFGRCVGACFSQRSDGSSVPRCTECETCATSLVCAPLVDASDCGCGVCRAGACEPALTAIGVVVGSTHTCALSDDRDLSCWGENDRGQLGTGEPASTVHTRPAPVLGDVRVADAAGGIAAYTCALGALDDARRCWGSNDDLNLGLGDASDRSTPALASDAVRFETIATGDRHACALEEGSHRAWCWGSNSHGALGAPAIGAESAAPTPVAGDRAFDEICVGNAFACGVSAGEVHCWGFNEDYQLGVADSADRGAPFRSDASSLGPLAHVTCGGYSACALTVDGQLVCWGGNQYCNTGLTSDRLGDSASPGVVDGRRYRAVDCGQAHCCAIERDTDALLCWGQNERGQCGLGTTARAVCTPTEVTRGTRWSSVAAGAEHTCAVDVEGRVACWGANDAAQLGTGDLVDRALPALVCLD